MLTKKKIIHLAKKLAALSVSDDGLLSLPRVDAALDVVRSCSERYRGLLMRQYRYFLEEKIRALTVVFEKNGKIDVESEVAKLERQFHKKLLLELRENPTLIAGARLTIGDMVFDRSLRSVLDSLRG